MDFGHLKAKIFSQDEYFSNTAAEAVADTMV